MIAPIVLPEQIPVAKLIPTNFPPVAPLVSVIDPVPVAAPIVFPVVVPILTGVPSATTIPYQKALEELIQLKLDMVLPWILLAVPVAVVNEIAVKTLSTTFFFKIYFAQEFPAHCAAEPPI